MDMRTQTVSLAICCMDVSVSMLKETGQHKQMLTWNGRIMKAGRPLKLMILRPLRSDHDLSLSTSTSQKRKMTSEPFPAFLIIMYQAESGSRERTQKPTAAANTS